MTTRNGQGNPTKLIFSRDSQIELAYLLGQDLFWVDWLTVPTQLEMKDFLFRTDGEDLPKNVIDRNIPLFSSNYSTIETLGAK